METEVSRLKDIEKSILLDHHKRIWWQMPLRSLVIVGVYLGACLVMLQPGYTFLAIIICPFLGFVLSGCVNAAHFCVHQGNSKSKGFRIIGSFWLTPLLTNYTIYKADHLKHHRFNGISGDPLLHYTISDLKNYFLLVSGFFTWASLLFTFIRLSKKKYPDLLKNDEQRAQATNDNRIITAWLITAVILTILFPKVMLLVYWIPLFIAHFFFWIFMIPEHYGINLEGENSVAYNTRSIRSTAFVRFFQWNANYHAEHHFFPSMPLLNLHSINKVADNTYVHKDTTYIGFHYKMIASTYSQKYRNMIVSETEENRKSGKSDLKRMLGGAQA